MPSSPATASTAFSPTDALEATGTTAATVPSLAVDYVPNIIPWQIQLAAFSRSEIRSMSIVYCVRGRPLSTSAEFSGFLTPPSPFVRISRNLLVLFVRKIGQILKSLPPRCGRTKWMVPNLVGRMTNSPFLHQP